MSNFPFVFNHPHETKLWRFMDFTKLFAMLNNREINFSRADQFDDPFEGSILSESIELYEEAKQNPKYESLINIYLKMMPNAKMATYISCWHINDFESAALWKLYTNYYDGIAIVTDFNKLSQLFKDYKYQDTHQIVYGQVHYRDFNEESFIDGNTASPFFFKRNSFLHENEFRALLQPFIMGEDGYPIDDSTKYPYSISIPFDPDDLIEKIVVAPYAPEWIVELVKQVVNNTECSIPVIKSELFEKTEKFYK